MREIRGIVIHCSATPNHATLFKGEPGKPGFTTPATAINEWHRARGFKRSDAMRKVQNQQLDAIGYHFVIGRNGAIFTGRHLDEAGAHVQGANQKTVGVCMVGTDSFTVAQWEALRDVVANLLSMPGIRGKPVTVLGHRDYSKDKNGDGKITSIDWMKTCPGFDVSKWLAGEMAPLAGHISEA